MALSRKQARVKYRAKKRRLDLCVEYGCEKHPVRGRERCRVHGQVISDFIAGLRARKLFSGHCGRSGCWEPLAKGRRGKRLTHCEKHRHRENRSC